MKGLNIFYYHLVSDTKKDYYPGQSTINVKIFDEQIKYFSKRFEIITINEAYYRFQSGSKFDKQLVITTDDGFVENYLTICPILESYKVKGSFFLIENSIDNIRMMWRHVLFVLQSKIHYSKLFPAMKSLAEEYNINIPRKNEELLSWSLQSFPNKIKDKLTGELWNKVMPLSLNEYLYNSAPYLTSVQINEILKGGHEIGSHTRSHPYCELLNDEELNYEINESIKSLGEKFNAEVLAFSFPFGRSKRVTEVIQKNNPNVKVQLGIRIKFNSNSGPSYFWERLNMETSSFKFRLLYTPIKNTLLFYH